MKIILAFVLLIAANSLNGMSVDELKMMHAMVSECVAKEGATDEDTAHIMEMLVPQTRTAMCLNACIMEKTSIIVGGKFSSANAVAAARTMTENNADKMAIVEEVTKSCEDQLPGGHEDRCEYAQQVSNCNTQGGLKHGYTQMQLLSP